MNSLICKLDYCTFWSDFIKLAHLLNKYRLVICLLRTSSIKRTYHAVLAISERSVHRRPERRCRSALRTQLLLAPGAHGRGTRGGDRSLGTLQLVPLLLHGRRQFRQPPLLALERRAKLLHPIWFIRDIVVYLAFCNPSVVKKLHKQHRDEVFWLDDHESQILWVVRNFDMIIRI